MTRIFLLPPYSVDKCPQLRSLHTTIVIMDTVPHLWVGPFLCSSTSKASETMLLMKRYSNFEDAVRLEKLGSITNVFCSI